MGSVDGRSCLEQRFSPWLRVRTTLHPQGLMIQVTRPFRESVAAVAFDRLVLPPTSLTRMRNGLLTCAGLLLGAGLIVSLVPGVAGLSPLVVSALIGASMLLMLLVSTHPRRLTVVLDREGALHPMFLRGGRDDADVERFLEELRRAAIRWRCDPPDPEPAARRDRPSLADRMDALLAMRCEGLLTRREFERFKDLAARG